MIEKYFKLTAGNEKLVEKVILDENLHYMHIIINKNDGFPEHNTNAVVYMTVLRGIVSLQLDDQNVNHYDTGNVLKIPFNTKMNLSNFHDETLELIVIKAPPPMNYASSDLIKEHEGILYGLKILEKMVLLLKINEKVETDDFRDMVDFFKLFADRCHHGKEENLFFPALEKEGVQNQNGPIGQMLIEHAEGRKYIAQMSESLRNNAIKKDEFISTASNYIGLLRAHINKENTELFPLADQKIPAEKQTELLILFEEFEETVMGIGTHERLHEVLNRFNEKYLEHEL